MAYKKQIVCLKLSKLKNPTFILDITQIQVVTFQYKHIFI